VGVLGYTCDGEWYSRLFVPPGDDIFPNSEHDLAKMFAAYERFVVGEPLANGRYIEIGTDLSGPEQITLTDAVGRLRAWGVHDGGSGRALLWIDNADHTWWNVVERVPVAAASATLSIPGLQAGTAYRVEWWDPYAGISADPILGVESVVAQRDGSLALRVQELVRDVAVKIMPEESDVDLHGDLRLVQVGSETHAHPCIVGRLDDPLSDDALRVKTQPVLGGWLLADGANCRHHLLDGVVHLP
jgi:hypothetical protein